MQRIWTAFLVLVSFGAGFVRISTRWSVCKPQCDVLLSFLYSYHTFCSSLYSRWVQLQRTRHCRTLQMATQSYVWKGATAEAIQSYLIKVFLQNNPCAELNMVVSSLQQPVSLLPPQKNHFQLLSPLLCLSPVLYFRVSDFIYQSVLQRAIFQRYARW